VTRDDWLSQFEDELKKLRPHVGDRLAWTLALSNYNPADHPRDKARQYDKAQRPPAPAPAKKRSK
jgi:NTP pyrophosphatase (non-canonical NTP hydrolase)